jgi:iron complex transport system ATP-binding protein
MPANPPLLELERVTVMRGAKTVLRDFSLRIEDGEHVAILGPNGCGKSTLIKTVTREVYPLAREGARVAIYGRETWHVDELRSLLGVVTNDLMAACTREMPGLEIVLSGFFSSIGIWPWHEVTPQMREAAWEALERLDAAHLAAVPVDEMSSGEARRILIARALVHLPRALIFDEPSNSLDLRAQHELQGTMSALARSGLTILLVTHHLSDIVPEIERAILLSNGAALADGPKPSVLTEANLTRLFGVPVKVHRHEGHYHLY